MKQPDPTILAKPFIHSGHPARIIFGSGSVARIPEECGRLGLERVLLIATSSQRAQADRLRDAMGDRIVATLSGAVVHTPLAVTEHAMRQVSEQEATGIVAIGGGAAIGLSKAIALRTDLPQIVVPTTYAGSEVTPVLGETENGIKVTKSDPRILPEVVIYDADLTLDLPGPVTATSGINAVAHAVEALYAPEVSPIVVHLALEGIRALAHSLPRAVVTPHDVPARAEALYGAWLCGTCLGAVGMALHHKLCHTLGGAFDLPHAATHAVMLPHALAYNAPAIPDVMAALRTVLATSDPVGALYALAGSLGVERSLAALGMPENGIERAADLALANPYWNPRPLDRTAIRRLIARAWDGEPPHIETR